MRIAGSKLGPVLIGLGAALFACSNLLGIEDLNPGPRAGGGEGGESDGGTAGRGTGGKSGSSSSSGKPGGGAGGAGGTGDAGGEAGGGGSSGDGSGGTAGRGGSTASGGRGGTGDAGAAGEVSGGTTGEAGTGTMQDPTVRGRVIDLFRMPVPNAPVAIGNVTTTTDVDGNFVIEDVPSEYDASVIVQANSRSFGWVYQGLTRREPTLQVYEQSDAGGAEFMVSHQNATFDTDSRWLLALGSEGGTWTEDQGTDASRDIWGYWVGPSPMTWGVHGLLFRRTAEGIPIGYDAYDTFTESASDQDAFSLTLDFQAEALTAAAVTGTVMSPEASQRINRLFTRFASGAQMPLVTEDGPGNGAYSYVMPALPDSSVTIAASYGPIDGPYAIAYRDGAQPGDTGMDVAIPQVAATPAGPNDNASSVTGATPFLVTKLNPDVGAFVVVIGGRYSYDGTGIYLVTSKTQFKLSDYPIVAGAFSLTADSEYPWWVESHGSPDSVDAMAGPEGGLDAFGLTYTEPVGPSRGEGSYTSSVTRTLRTAQ